VKVHATSSVQHTGQLFFKDSLIDAIYKASPYSSRPGPDVRNNADGIYRQGGPSTVMSLQPTGDGYAGTITLGVKH